jgi:hypothetical protein
MSSSIAVSKSVTALSCCASSSRPSSSCFRSSRLFLRSRSIARCFAVAMSHAPGLSGTPDSGHCSSAATRASCASSSARPTSRTIRARPAMSLADSILQTASMVRCVSVAVTATHHTIFKAPAQAGSLHAMNRASTRPRCATASGPGMKASGSTRRRISISPISPLVSGWELGFPNSSTGGTQPPFTRRGAPRPRCYVPLRGSCCACSSGNFAAAFLTSAGKSENSCTWRTSITSLSEAGQRDAHSTASSFDFT